MLGQLVREGFVKQTRGTTDRRQRLLELTETGRELERKLTEVQKQRIARAYRDAGAEAVAGFRTVMRGLIDSRDRTRFETEPLGPERA